MLFLGFIKNHTASGLNIYFSEYVQHKCPLSEEKFSKLLYIYMMKCHVINNDVHLIMFFSSSYVF